MRRPTPHRPARPATAALLLLLAAPTGAVPAADPPLLATAGVGTTDGHATLTWELPDEGDPTEHEFELQRALTPDFAEPKTMYRGPGSRSFVSGLERGVHHFRVRQRGGEGDEWSAWSDTVEVTIDPYSLRAALSMFALGFVLVASIIGYLAFADRRTRRTPTGS